MPRTFHAGLFGAALLLGLAASAWAKPKGIQIDKVMDDALLIAEVEVVEVHPAGNLRDAQVSSAATVRVTTDIARVYKGFAWMGRSLQVTSDFGSAQSFAVSMQSARAKKQTFLLVVRKDRSAVLEATHAKNAAGEDVYSFGGWYDWNGVMIYSTDKTFGERDDNKPFDGFRLKLDQLRERYAQEAQAFRARGAAWLLVQPGAPDEALAAAIAKLDSEDFAEREDATKALAARGEAVLPALAAARERAKSQEVRTRLDEVLNANFEASGAYHWAQRVKAEGARAEAALLLEYSKTPRVPSEPLVRRLGDLAKAEKLGVPERADLDALKAAWTKALAADANAHVQPGKTP